MSEIIDSYEEELKENIQAAQLKVDARLEGKEDWKELRALLTDCEKGIKLIETELVGQPPQVRAGRTAKLREHKRKYDQLKKTAFEKENNWGLEMGKRELMGTRSSEFINSYDRSTEVTERLRESVKVMLESEEIGDNVNNQLADQTGKLIKNKDKLVEIRHDLTKSERRIKSMMLRIRKNKFVLRGVIGFIILVFIIVIVSYFR